jgi:DNA topoisomerase-1
MARLTGFDGEKHHQDVGDQWRSGRRSSAMLEAASSGRQRRGQADPAQSGAAVHHLDAAAGGLVQARLPPARTMQVAQKLYEGIDIGGETVGLITYMRTDGVQMAPEAITEARDAIGKVSAPLRAGQAAPLFDQGQERPGGSRGDPPDRLRAHARRVKRYLDADQLRLYDLIWKRGSPARWRRPNSNARPSRSPRRRQRQDRGCARPVR